MRRSFASSVLALTLAACETAIPAPPAPAPTGPERWVQDADYALSYLSARHPNLFHAEPRARFEAELAPLRAQGSALERRDVFFGLMRMVALAHDSHTRLASLSEIEDLRLPILLQPWSDGLWIGAVGEQARQYCAQRVVRLAGRTPEELYAAFRPLVPHENETVLAFGAAALATLPRALLQAGLIGRLGSVPLELEDLEGMRRTVALEPRPATEIGGWIFFGPRGWRAPLSRRATTEPWWWCPLPEDGSLYLQYNQCLQRPEGSFERTAEEILARIDRGCVPRLVIDLRLNGGGDSRVLRPLLHGLKQRAFRDERVIVAIGPQTYSSAMINAHQLRRELGAVLVGEPTSQKPDSYGEVRGTVLPNTGWALDCSTKSFRPFGDDRPSLAPDVQLAQGFADLLAGRDPVLEWVLGHPAPGR